MKVSYIFIGEGTSDLRLTEHIESILITEGFEEVSGEAPDMTMLDAKAGNTVKNKLEVIKRFYPSVDIIFVHRDADGAGIEARELEIETARGLARVDANVIPVIPVKMLETWLLADKEKLNIVAGNTKTDTDIKCLPKLAKLEKIADSKALLMDVLCESSGATGGRLKDFKKRFNEMRARLTYDLDPDGPVNKLTSYTKFRSKLTEMADNLLARNAEEAS
ncbi:MAG: hypothetical protein COA41_11530 [Sphingopyxis sp.]|nr:MAG: hypothetical protein COA41_11530 [Sphingopyxis sp.]